MPADNVSFSAGAAWTVYTPAWASTGTQPAIGNGTSVGRYHILGHTVIFTINMTMGSTSTYGTGAYTVVLPTNAVNPMQFSCGFHDTSATAFYGGFGRYNLGTDFAVITTLSPAGFWQNNTPFVWAVGDVFQASGLFEGNIY